MTGEGCTMELKEMSIWGAPGSFWTMLFCESGALRCCGVGALHPSPLTPSLTWHHKTRETMQVLLIQSLTPNKKAREKTSNVLLGNVEFIVYCCIHLHWVDDI